MNIYTKRRTRPTVPIVTLIDILAILLIFFIVTTTFKKKESLVQVSVPKSSEMEASDAVETRTVLALSKDGQISLGDELVALDQLGERLTAFRAANESQQLELKADEGAPLGMMVKVWDAASKAGLEIGDLPLRILLEE